MIHLTLSWNILSVYPTICLNLFPQVQRLYAMFCSVDCLQLEVNPLAETPDGLIYTADAKLGFDDNASFRQKYVKTLFRHRENESK